MNFYSDFSFYYREIHLESFFFFNQLTELFPRTIIKEKKKKKSKGKLNMKFLPKPSTLTFFW